MYVVLLSINIGKLKEVATVWVWEFINCSTNETLVWILASIECIYWMYGIIVYGSNLWDQKLQYVISRPLKANYAMLHETVCGYGEPGGISTEQPGGSS